MVRWKGRVQGRGQEKRGVRMEFKSGEWDWDVSIRFRGSKLGREEKIRTIGRPFEHAAARRVMLGLDEGKVNPNHRLAIWLCNREKSDGMRLWA